MSRNRISFALLVLFIFSLGFLIWAEVNNKSIGFLAGLPLVGTLVAALFQIVLKQIEYGRQMLLQDHQNRFVLGAGSHMANVAFDKHVKFCEKYVGEAHKVLSTMYRDGPSADIFEHLKELMKVRQDYAVWLTVEVERKLDIFEGALRKMQSSAAFVSTTAGGFSEYSENQRPKHLDRMYKIFAQVTGEKEWDGEELTDELAIHSQVRYLRDILGVEELSRIRQEIVTKAMSEFEKSS